MKFMILLKADRNTEAGVLPSEKFLAAMGQYNDELVKAGVLLAAEGLQPSARGARVKFSQGRHTVIHGPFPETSQLLAGIWMLQVNSKQEAIDWIKRCPSPLDGEFEMEIRQVFDAADLGDAFTPGLSEVEKRIAVQMAAHADS